MAKKKNSFQEIFDLDAERKRTAAIQRKVIPFREYLELVRKDPLIAQNSPARLRDIVLDQGVEDIPDLERWLGVGKRYSMFSDVLYGVEKPIADLMEYLGTSSLGFQPVSSRWSLLAHQPVVSQL